MLDPEIKALYKAPFRLCHMSIYLLDANGETVADFMYPDNTFRTRGWGRIKQMHKAGEAERLHDKAEAFFQNFVSIAGISQNPQECVKAFNELWSERG